jgi:uncharacterized membrane protein YgcG
MRHYSFFLILFLWLFSENANAEYFVIRDYKVDIQVFGDQGMFQVNEEITVEFNEPRRGVFRNIPYRYKINGEEVKIKIFDVHVEGHKFSTYTENNDYLIKIGDKDIFLDGIQKYKISYKVKKAFVLTEEHTEFYWNLIGIGWPVPIDSITYSVKLDQALSMSENDYYIYTGSDGEKRQDATVSYFIDKFSGHSTRPFGPNEGLTLAIKLPKDYIRRPSSEEILWEKYGMAGIGGILFLIISGLFYRTWRLYGKDYPIVRMVQYVPPPDLNPAEAGVLIDEKADNVDILALLPYWAHHGLITIKRIPVKWGKDDHELTKINNLPENAGPYEKIIFDGLFEDGNSVLVSSLENSFYEYLQSAKQSLKSHLNSMGVYYPVSMKMQITTAIVSVLLAFAAIGLGIIFQSFALGIGLGLTSIVGLIFANFMLKKNERGVHLYQQVLGFKMFVKAAEKDKIERMLKEDPEYFEKTLPYAMIFGYAKQWSKKFDGLLIEPPKWYVAPHGMYYHGNTFSPSEFGASFDSGIRDIQSVFTSMPASSGGGGSFSGGGSSGGGFGGGGGGSW